MDLKINFEVDDDSTLYITFNNNRKKIDIQRSNINFIVDDPGEYDLIIEQKATPKSMNIFMVLLYFLLSFIQAPFYAISMVDKEYFIKIIKPYYIRTIIKLNISESKNIKLTYISSSYDEIQNKWIKQRLSVEDVEISFLYDSEIKYHINKYAFSRSVFHYSRFLIAVGIFLEALFIILLYKTLDHKNILLTIFLSSLCILLIISISIAINAFNKKIKKLYNIFLLEDDNFK